MKVVISNSLNDQIYTIDIEASQTLEDLKVLVEVHSELVIQDQELLFNNNILPNDRATIE